MSFPRYPKYKDSGVEWLGDVPSSWQVIPLSRITHSRCDGPFGSGLKSEHYTDDGARVIRLQNIRAGEFYGADSAFIPLDYFEGELSGHDVVAGDVLIAGLGDDNNCVGRACVAPTDLGPALVKADCFRFRLDGRAALPSFTALQLSAGAEPDAGRLAAGTTRSRIPLSAMASRRVALPSMSEQVAIAAFLDRESKKIGALVAEQEKLIVLLKEKRQAVISNAVTKGLNPDAPMKASGMEWLGDVPAHWDVVRIGAIFRETSDVGGDDLPILSVSIHDGVSDKELEGDEMERKVTRSDDRSKYKAVRPGDLAYNMMRAWQGGFGTVTVDGQVSPAYIVARPCTAIRTEFIEQILRTPQAVEQMRRHSRGITDFRLRLYWEEFKNIRVALPTVTEQESILGSVAAETSRFDSLTEEAESAIALLKERRRALISAAVTGQIDVRGLESLPQVTAPTGPVL